MSGVIFCHSRPVPVKQGLSLNLEISGSLALVRVIGMCRKSGLLCACWDLNSGPHDFTASTVTLAVDISKKKKCVYGVEVGVHTYEVGQRSTSTMVFCCFLLYFVKQDLTETGAHHFELGWLASELCGSLPEGLQVTTGMLSFELISVPPVCRAGTVLPEPSR